MKLYEVTLQELASKPFLWHHTSNPDVYMLKAFKQEDLYVSRARLFGLDERLPAAIDHVIATTSAPQLQGSRVVATIAFWQHPAPVLKGVNAPDTETYIIGARQAVLSSIDENHVTANLVTVEIEKVANIPIARNPSTGVFVHLSNDWMEKHYPHSVARLKAGTALNMGVRELAEYVFDFVEDPEHCSELPSNMAV